MLKRLIVKLLLNHTINEGSEQDNLFIRTGGVGQRRL